MTDPLLVFKHEAPGLRLGKPRIAHAKLIAGVAGWTKALVDHPHGLWLSADSSALAECIIASGQRRSSQRLLLLEEAESPRWELLRSHFEQAFKSSGFELLAREELLEVLTSEERKDRFIAAAADKQARALLLLRGNLEPVIVPVGWFHRSRKGPKPDLDDCAVTDWGQTVRMGEYEAAADAILYHFDRSYRRRAKARRVEQDASFGGALRRLRLQRGIARYEFPGVSSKEIARIERGEVARPHAATLTKIAKRLRVAPGEIQSY